ncbi:HD domain-containing protein [candidate division WS5 bacterium]|uniref:HD domain-containing protein n=1 Tax=candidate division WS5 bacterium TaxID=2093353 RepID=A0A419DA77_9BACT|nr:MAG: HD domain-containing protein [candidate division WS5 bacterium]
MKKLFVEDLKVGDSIFGELFAVKNYKKTATRNNRPYIDVELSDKTGSIKGKVWSDDMANCESVELADVVSISATVEDFNGPQLRITNLSKVDKYDLGDFQPTASRDIEKMFEEITEAVASIKNPSLKKLLKEFLNDKETVEMFKKGAGGYTVHHDYLGGLLDHTTEMLGYVPAICKTHPKINKDMLVTGIILHDIGKIHEYEVSTSIVITPKLKLLGHIFMGAEMVKRYGEKAGLDEDLLDEVLHMVLSHQGRIEFGSPILPKTPEAMILYRLDDMSAKLNTAFKLLESGEGGDERFTNYQRNLETELYRSPYTDELTNEDIPF